MEIFKMKNPQPEKTNQKPNAIAEPCCLKKKLILLISVSILLLVLSTNQKTTAQNVATTKYRFPYNLTYSAQKFMLPRELTEISGIVYFDKNTIIGIQDEKGRLYFYDIREKKITREIKFFDEGDFEDIALVGNSMFALRSDGLLVEVENFTSKENLTVKKFFTPLSLKNDCEGLCYDKTTNSLFIALKEMNGIKEKDDQPGFRAIYSFDLDTKTLSEKPAYLIKISTLDIPEKYPSKSKKKSGEIKFKPSAVAIHPITNEIYVLASVGNKLIVLNRNGEVVYKTGLDKKFFPQPEGIAFSPEGSLFICNEGGDGTGTLLRFDMK